MSAEQPTRDGRAFVDLPAIEAKTRELVQRFRARFPNAQRIPFSERNAVVARGGQREDFANPLGLAPEVFREVRVYNQTLAGVKRALVELHREGVKLSRPNDFYAEMIKSDAHMEGMRRRLEEKKKGLELSRQKIAEKKHRRSFRKEKHRENVKNAEEKKGNLVAIEQWKKEIRAKKTDARDLDHFIKKGAIGAKSHSASRPTRGKQPKSASKRGKKPARSGRAKKITKRKKK